MTARTRALHAAVALLLGAGPVAGQSCLTTLFSSNNGLGDGGGNLFDLTVVNAIRVQAIEVNANDPPPNTHVSVEVYVTSGTYVGKELDPTAWTLVATGSATANPENTPTAVPLTLFDLPEGSWGMAVFMFGVGPAYTNGNGSNQQYANDDLRIDLGASLNAKFRGNIFQPRVWNGALCYSPSGVLATYCTAKVNSLGCAPSIGSAGIPRASSSSGFVVSCRDVRNDKVGVLLYSLDGRRAVPFHGGFLCLAPAIRRTPGTLSGGPPAPIKTCEGLWRIDMNAFAAGASGGNPAPGLRTVGACGTCQWWGRDPDDAFGSALSEAVQYVVLP